MPEERSHEDVRPLNGAQTLILIILCFVFPPLPVFLLKENSLYSRELLLSILLTILGHVPGVLFSIYYVVVEYPRKNGFYCCSQGYIRIEDHENEDPESRPMESESTHNEEPNYTNPEAQVQEETTHQGSSQNIHSEPPSYDEVANNNPFKSDLKRDNKVQF